jgi:WD40 repeat protein
MDASGAFLVGSERRSDKTSTDVASIWDLNGPPDADPRVVRKGAAETGAIALESSGLWLATAHESGTVLWPLGGRHPWVLRGPPFHTRVAFTRDGNWLVSSSSSTRGVHLFPLSPEVAHGRRVFLQGIGRGVRVAMDPMDQDHLLAASLWRGRPVLAPLDGGTPRELPRFSQSWIQSVAISRDGRLAAAGTRHGPEGSLIEVWDLESGGVRALRVGKDDCGFGSGIIWDVAFTSDGRLLAAGATGLRLWDLEEETNTLLRPCMEKAYTFLAASSEDRFLLIQTQNQENLSVLSFYDLRAGTSHEITSHGNGVGSVALDPKGEVAVTGSRDGIVRVGPVTGEAPHLLYGHHRPANNVKVSPDGRWIASASEDGTIRLWPMPTGQPLHTLPYEEILERLGSFTNLRVVRDEGAETGYRVEAGPFPGWAVLPKW